MQAEFFDKLGEFRVVICANKRSFAQLEMIEEHYGGSHHDGIYTVNGIDILDGRLEEPERNIKIVDYGYVPTDALDLHGFDKVFLVGGTSWNELPMIYAAQQPLNGINYTVAVNFSDKESVERNREALMLNLNPVLLLPFEADSFAVGKYEKLFDDEFIKEFTDLPTPNIQYHDKMQSTFRVN